MWHLMLPLAVWLAADTPCCYRSTCKGISFFGPCILHYKLGLFRLQACYLLGFESLARYTLFGMKSTEWDQPSVHIILPMPLKYQMSTKRAPTKLQTLHWTEEFQGIKAAEVAQPLYLVKGNRRRLTVLFLYEGLHEALFELWDNVSSQVGQHSLLDRPVAGVALLVLALGAAAREVPGPTDYLVPVATACRGSPTSPRRACKKKPHLSLHLCHAREAH